MMLLRLEFIESIALGGRPKAAGRSAMVRRVAPLREDEVTLAAA